LRETARKRVGFDLPDVSELRSSGWNRCFPVLQRQIELVGC